MGNVRSVAAAAALSSLVVVTTTHVDIRNNAFQPSTVEVAANDTVQWTNRDQIAHTVKFIDRDSSGDIPPGKSHSDTFATPGTYRYTCEIHPTMTGTVEVRASSPTSSTTTTTRPRPTSTTTTTTTTTTPTTIASDEATSTSTTTTTIASDEATTSTAAEDKATAVTDKGDSGGDNVDGPGAVAALLLLLTAGATFLRTRAA